MEIVEVYAYNYNPLVTRLTHKVRGLDTDKTQHKIEKQHIDKQILYSKAIYTKTTIRFLLQVFHALFRELLLAPSNLVFLLK